MFVMSAFHPSFVHNLHKPLNRSVEFLVHCVVWGCEPADCKTWMEATNDIPYKNFFVTTEPNRMGFSENADN